MNLRRLSLRLRPLSALLAVVVGVASAQRADACGGCFVQPSVSSPIVQEAERVLFIRDAASGTSTVWVEIRYNGPAADFGWVLPLPKVPDKVGVGTPYFFDRLDEASGPRFILESGPAENCGFASDSVGCGWSDDASARTSAREDVGNGEGKGNVTVLSHDQVGPYDYKLIQGTSATDVQKWLSDNGFATPPAAIPVLEDHVANGFVFLAVKLAAGKTAKEIKPIALTLPQIEPCVPLRLTSIAAVEDALVEVSVVGPGRAIPKNHLHVRLNPVRFNWFDLGSNYGQVLAAAIDEAAGRAFVTEFAGAPPQELERVSSFSGVTTEALFPAGALKLPTLAKSTTACEVLGKLKSVDFPITDETAAILERVTGLAAAAGQSDPLAYFGSDYCNSITTVDGEAIQAALENEFSAPLREVVGLYKAQAKLTRLAMRISPSEMTKDPVFAFSSTLPDVSRDWRAVSNVVCSGDSFTPAQYRVTLEGVGSWRFDLPEPSTGIPQQFGPELPITSADPRFADAPAALAIELLDETGPVVPIAPAQIELVDSAIATAREGQPQLPTGLVLHAAPSRYTPPLSDPPKTASASADACNGGRRPAPAAGLLLAPVAALVWLRRRRSAVG